MEKSGLKNCYDKGFFLHCNGIVFSESDKAQVKDIFSYSEGDIISIHKQDYKIYFHRIRGSKVSDGFDDGFYVNLKPFEEEGTLNRK